MDEMIAVSEFLEHEDDDGRHIQATGGWNHYNTLFEVGGHFFQGETQIMMTDEGPLFYDITKIEDITSPLRTANKMDSRGRDNASEENIADHKRNVNEKFSLKTNTGSEENRALFDKTKKIFGTTFNWNTAGYILPDGTRRWPW